jgi:hypothetical protein
MIITRIANLCRNTKPPFLPAVLGFPGPAAIFVAVDELYRNMMIMTRQITQVIPEAILL